MIKQFYPINVLFILLVALFLNTAFADNAEQLLRSTPFSKSKETIPLIVPQPPHVNAKSYILIDVNSGATLAEHNANKRLPPASLTKMMTLYLVSNALKSKQLSLEDTTRISRKAWKTGGSRMFVKEKQQVSIADLIQGIIVHSGNDAAVAIAEFIAGNEQNFVQLMNEQATQLGLKNTYFTDSYGTPHAKHYSSSRDLATLGRALILNHPEDYQQWYKQKWFTFNKIRQPNRNRLLWRDEHVDGIKTGHTEEAGYCLVASSQKNGMRLLAVVMGSPSDGARTVATEQLLHYGFRFYKTHKLYQAGQILTTPRTWQGQRKTIPLGLSKDVFVTIPKNQYHNLNVKLALPEPITAPISKGQTIGEINILLQNKILFSHPLIALSNNRRGNLWVRLRDKTTQKTNQWFSSHSVDKRIQLK